MYGKILMLTVLVALGLPRPGWSVNSASVQNFWPVVDPSPYLSISSSRTLKPWKFHVGFLTNYARRPILRGTDIVTDDIFFGDLFGSVGLFLPWIELGVNLPAAFHYDSAALSTIPITAGSVPRTTGMALGDIRVETKFRILDLDRYHIGIAAIPFMTAPTGDSDHLLGSGGFNGGGRIVIDFKFLERAELALNFAYLMRKNFEFPGTAPDAVTIGTERDDSYLVGLGLTIKTLDWMDIVGEVSTSAIVKAPLDRESETPVEAGGGFRFRIPAVKGLAAIVGGGAGLTFGYGSPSYRAMGGVTYTHPVREYVPPPPPPPEPEPEEMVELTPEKIVIHRKVHFTFGGAHVRKASHPLLEAVINILNENPRVRKVQVGGHTDDRGGERFNLHLSQKRAESVQRFLIERGIDPERVTAKGFGASNPLDTNDTDLGRARNRRVEFTILEQDEKIVVPRNSTESPAM